MSNTVLQATNLIPEVLEDAHTKTEKALQRLDSFRDIMNEVYSDFEELRDAHEDMSEVLGMPLQELKRFIRSTILLTRELDDYFDSQPTKVIPFNPNLQLTKRYLREVKSILSGLEVDDV